MLMLSGQPVKRKRSVSDDKSLAPPIKILEMSMRAYQQEFINEKDRLQHAAYVAASYLGGFRIGEVLGLLKSQFKRMLSLEKREFWVINAVEIEKSGGRMRNCPIYPKDPLSIPLIARLNEIENDGLLFHFTERTGRNIAGRISGGQAWPHWFRAQRNRFLSTAFIKADRKIILGWSAGGGKKTFHDSEDFYASLNWMSYADRLAMLTESYWNSETIPQETKGWLDSLLITTTTTT